VLFFLISKRGYHHHLSGSRGQKIRFTVLECTLALKSEHIRFLQDFVAW